MNQNSHPPSLDDMYLDVPLHEDLREYVTTSPIFGRALVHPLVSSLVYNEMMNCQLNWRYEFVVAAVEEAKLKNDWSEFVFHHEKPYRILAFLEIESKMSDEQYWTILRETFECCENIWQHLSTWERLLSSSRRDASKFMTDDEVSFLASLPERFVVYRGCLPDFNERGFSYSLSREVAERLGGRWGRGEESIVVERSLAKADCFAFLNGRNEQEIIVRPEAL